MVESSGGKKVRYSLFYGIYLTDKSKWKLKEECKIAIERLIEADPEFQTDFDTW